MLKTKLFIPSTNANIVHRSELFDKLDQGLEKKLTLISAPAGFGKTTVLSDWINVNNIQTAWYSIDKSDNDPVKFMTYFIAGIQTLIDNFGENVLQILQSPQKLQIESILGMLINEVLNIEKDITFVFDDFHLIDSPEIFEIITYLLDYKPQQLHIVLSTRSDPRISISLLRSQDQIIEIRSDDLSFTSNDITTFFNSRFNFDINTHDIQLIKSKTEGWIAGLQLTALSMQSQKDKSEFINDFAGDNRYIMDYLIEEVLESQDDNIKQFLLQTSLFEQFSGSLCDFILDRNDSQRIIESLEKHNMFIIPLDTERNWFRYHHLFADLLKHRLKMLHKNKIIELHNKASIWFEENDYKNLAIDHALSAKNYNKAVSILENISEHLWESGQHVAMMNYGEILDDEIIKYHLKFCIYYSWILIGKGQVELGKKYLDYANDQLPDIPTDENDLKGKLYITNAYFALSIGDVKQIKKFSELALDNISDKNALWRSWAHVSLGDLYSLNREIPKASHEYIQAIKHSEKSQKLFMIFIAKIKLVFSEKIQTNYKNSHRICNDLIKESKTQETDYTIYNSWYFSGFYSYYGAIEFEWNNREEGFKNLKIGFDLSKSGNEFVIYNICATNYSLALYLDGKVAEALKIIEEVEPIVKTKQVPPWMAFPILAWKARLLLELDEIEKTSQILLPFEPQLKADIPYILESVFISLARLYIKNEKYEEAENLLNRLLELTIKSNRLERKFEIQFVLIKLQLLLNDEQKAIDILVDLLIHSESANLIRSYISKGEEIENLLQIILNESKEEKSDTKLPIDYIEKLLLVFETEKSHHKKKSDEIISKRELEILKLLAVDLSNQEIADKLFISLNTVKTHAKKIYMKLDVPNRRQAVKKAQEMGLI
ncbi:hypothetical protein HNV12_19550 [Methanococcoides sp. SA1]|nr:hypothetical protein [Methanococcoides sp. SA1]